MDQWLNINININLKEKEKMVLPYSFDQEKIRPDRLFDLCINYLADHLECVAEIDSSGNYFKLKSGLFLPDTICDAFVRVYQSKGNVIDDKFLNTFLNPNSSRLTTLNLLNCQIKDEKTLWSMLKHKLFELDLNNCSFAERGIFLPLLNKYGGNLSTFSCGKYMSAEILLPAIENNAFEDWGYVINAPNLKSLKIMNLYVSCTQNFLSKVIFPLKKLTELDLSGSEFKDLTCLTDLPCLISLSLHRVDLGNKGLASIGNVRLKHLDVSHINFIYGDPDFVLSSLIERLVNLVSLDISGTNLAGYGKEISGLKSHLENPLEFLGLYNTHKNACRRAAIPASRISGDADAVQVMNAAIANMQKSEIMKSVLVNIMKVIKSILIDVELNGYFEKDKQCIFNCFIRLVLDSMDIHQLNQGIQEIGVKILCLACESDMDIEIKWNLKQCIIYVFANELERTGLFPVNKALQSLLSNLDNYKDPVLANAVARRIIQNPMYAESLIPLLARLVQSSDKTVKDLLVNYWNLFQVIQTVIKNISLTLKTACFILDILLAECADYRQKFVEEGGIEFLVDIVPRALKNLFGSKTPSADFICDWLKLFNWVAMHQCSSIMTDQFLNTVVELHGEWKFNCTCASLMGCLLPQILSFEITAWTSVTLKREVVLNALKSTMKTYLWCDNYEKFDDILRLKHLLNEQHSPELQLWFGLGVLGLKKTDDERYLMFLNENLKILPLLKKVTEYKHMVKAQVKSVKNLKEFHELPLPTFS